MGSSALRPGSIWRQKVWGFHGEVTWLTSARVRNLTLEEAVQDERYIQAMYEDKHTKAKLDMDVTMRAAENERSRQKALSFIY